MSLDLTTGFLLFFPLTLVMVVANRFTIANLPGQQFVRHWNAYLVTWLVTYVSIFAQSYVPLVGQLAVRACTPFFVFSYLRTIHALLGRPRIPTIPFVALVIVTEIPMLAEILFTSGDQVRAWLGSVHHVSAHVYGVLILTQVRSRSDDSVDISSRQGFIGLRLLEIAFVGVFVARALIGILTVSAASAGNLMEESLYNVVSALLVPQLVLLLSLFFVVLSHSIESHSAAVSSRRLLGRTADSRLLHLASGFSHEISGYLGNLVLLVDTMISRDLSSEERASVSELGDRAFAELRAIVADRHRLAKATLADTDQVDLKTTLALLNQLLSRGYVARGVRFASDGTNPTVGASLRYLITVLHGVAELAARHHKAVGETLTVTVVPEERDDRQLLRLTGALIRPVVTAWSGGTEPEAQDRDLLRWVRTFTEMYFDGSLHLEADDQTDSSITLSLPRARQ